MFQFSLKTMFAFITWALVTYSLVAWIVPFTGFGAMGPMLLVYLASTVVLAALLYRFCNHEGMYVICTVGAIVFVYVFIGVEVAFLSWKLEVNPPPRPMFHNAFASHDRGLLPYWHRAWPILDRGKNVMWSDYEDNVLLAVVGGDEYWTWPIPGLDETRLFDSDESGDRMVAIGRTTNQLIILIPDGTVGRFPLPPNVAQSFNEQCQTQSVGDLFADVGMILDPEAKDLMDAFLITGDSPEVSDRLPQRMPAPLRGLEN